ncbi:MAG: response regulator [Calditrichaeota bacterium]|nr:response regulator [Calditrichota bacterium]
MSPKKTTQKFDSGITKKMLIIDDSEVNRYLLETVLSHLGYDTIAAVNGEAGLAEFKKSQPFITFLDIVMPGKSGLEILKQINEISPSSIVVMVSSFSSKENLFEAKKAGANWFLVKPITASKIAELVAYFEKKSLQQSY